MPYADELIGPYTARSLYRAIRAVLPASHLIALSEAASALDSLALRARADLLRDALLAGVPGDYPSFAAVIREAHQAGGLSGWAVWPVTSAVAQKAVEDGAAAAFDDALDLLAELTGLLTSEFAIRTLLRHDLDRALDAARRWTRSGDEDVRRLATEGTRPYLPWSVRVPEIIDRPGVTVPILDSLYRDDSEYVRRSVANHLNDLSRDHPAIVVDTATRWLIAPDENTPRLVRNGLRTLVKRGYPDAMALLGFGPVDLEVVGPKVDRDRVPFGGSVRFTATIHNIRAQPARLSVDYVIHHVRANGSRTGKTFKLTTRTLDTNEIITIDREHSFRAITTRRYYPGLHAIALQLNGVTTDLVEFEILAP